MSQLSSDVVKNKEISIKLNEESFSDLILNFLGKKEKIKYTNTTTFNIRLNDIEQFYYLLDEKIKKEQFTHINNFTLAIIYNDNTSRELTGIEKLNEFNETRDVYVTGLTLTWNIILKFPKNETVENQKIDISFYIFDKEKDEENISDGYVLINIEHTNQAWALEVLNLLKTHTGNLITKQSNKSIYYKKIKNNLSYKLMIYFLLFVICFLFHVININKKPCKL